MAHAVDLTDLSRHPLEMQGFAVGTGRTADRRRAKNARADLARRHRDCLHCGEVISLVAAVDISTGVKRIMVIDPRPSSLGWLCINDDGAWVDDEFTLVGDRYERHHCSERRAALKTTNQHKPRLSVNEDFDLIYLNTIPRPTKRCA